MASRMHYLWQSTAHLGLCSRRPHGHLHRARAGLAQPRTSHLVAETSKAAGQGSGTVV